MTQERITSRQNPLMAQVRKLVSSRRARRELGLYLGEGTKLLQEAVRWQAQLDTVIAVDELELPTLPQGVRLVRVPEDVMTAISPMETPQGALFLARIPQQGGARALTGTRYLVLDGLQDPGNVGTIWRTADALGADGLILTGHSADPWNWKTVRATMGACFRLPVMELEGEALYTALTEGELPLYATALRSDTRDLRQAQLQRCAVAIGSEGSGVSQQLLERCAGTFKIPMRDRCESLNAAAAAAVVLWEMAR